MVKSKQKNPCRVSYFVAYNISWDYCYVHILSIGFIAVVSLPSILFCYFFFAIKYDEC